MLHIADNYWAKKSKRGYTVLKEMEKKNEDQNPTYSTVGYTGTMKEAIELVKSELLRSHIDKHDVELCEVLYFIREQTDRILKAMVGIDI